MLTANFSDIVKPFNELTSKNTPLCQVNFEAVKIALTNGVILIFPDHNSGYVLYMDAFEHSWSAVHTQERLTKVNEKDVSFLPITYISGTFVGCERNWATLTNEAYVIYMV